MRRQRAIRAYECFVASIPNTPLPEPGTFPGTSLGKVRINFKTGKVIRPAEKNFAGQKEVRGAK